MEEFKRHKLEAVVMSINIKNDISIFLGSNKVNIKPFNLFDELIVNFFHEISNEIKKTKKNIYPDLSTLGFWLRKSNLINSYKKLNITDHRLGRGLSFQIAPNNIPLNFFYTFAYSLLSGNNTIIRVSSTIYPQREALFKIINKILNKKEFQKIKNKFAIVYYDKKINSLFDQLNKVCDIRVVWGSNETVQYFKNIPTKPRCFDIYFGDRYSFSLIDPNAFIKLSSKNRKVLITKFYNDTYLNDQNSCSAPHLVIWYGKKNEKAVSLFWNTLNDYVKLKYDFDFYKTSEKYRFIQKNAIQNKYFGSILSFQYNLNILNLKNIFKNIDQVRGRWGFFLQYSSEDLNFLKNIVNSNFQTLSYYGINSLELKKFIISKGLNGIDRVVPIGHTLDINLIWDGWDIIRSLSRVIEVRHME